MTIIPGLFGEMNFSEMKEADVREEIITPLLKRIGYGITGAKISRAHRLKHPFLKYGHRETPIQAEADYLLEVDGNYRWILEAKPPEPISDEDICQTYSYTVHHEVNGIYFVICNGLELRIYQTHTFQLGTSPVLSVGYRELSDNVEKLDNIIGPNAIRRDFPIVSIDTEEGLAPSLRSRARIIKGLIRISSSDARFRAIDGLTWTIVNGDVFRDENGLVTCTVDTCAPLVELQELNRNLGLESMRLHSEWRRLSTNSSIPSVLRGKRSVHLSRGISIPIMGATQQRMPYDVDCNVSTTAQGYLEGNVFKGTFVAGYEYFFSGEACGRSPFVQRGPSIQLQGDFEAELR